MGDVVLGRRGFLIGASGVLLAGCGSGKEPASSGGSSASPSPSGPVINKKSAGNVVSAEDLQALVSRLDELLGAGDVDGLMKALGVESHERDEWQSRVTAVRTVPLVDNHFYVTSSNDRLVNGSGGAVEFRSTLVMTHRIPDCDAHAVAQTFDVELVKPGEGQPVGVVRCYGTDDDEVSPLPWELARIASVAGRRATLLTRAADLDAVRRYVPLADAGVAAAMAAIPPPKGASKVAFTMAWDQRSDEETFGRREKTIDRAAFCTYVSFVDPQELADGTVKPDDRGATTGRSGRVLMRRSSRRSDADFRETACHEAVHALAGQWGTADSWVAEGLAEWVSSGYSAGVRVRSYGEVRSGFGAFAGEVVRDDFGYDEFQAEGTNYRNYQCSAAIFSWAEQTRGRAAAVRLARACYEDGAEKGVRRALGTSFPAMVQEVAAWLPRW